MTTTVTRYHDISMGHRVAGHENKCAYLHGHNYRIHFTCEAQHLDEVGRVIDFDAIKQRLCKWLEENWDHKFLVWIKDDMMDDIIYNIPGHVKFKHARLFQQSMARVPFNPTAENIASYLVEHVGPEVLSDTDVVLTSVRVDETRKCSATYKKENK